MSHRPSKRLYIRGLSGDAGADMLRESFSGFGKIVEVKLVYNYAFVEFEELKDAEDACEASRKKPLLGRDVVVEYARPMRRDMPSTGGGDGRHPDPADIRPRSAPYHAQSRYPVLVTNIPREVCWQELKDFGRQSGALVAYCDLDKTRRGRGFIEYFSREDAERAILKLDGAPLGGKRVKVSGRQPRSHPIGRVNDRARSRSPNRHYSSLRFTSSRDTVEPASPLHATGYYASPSAPDTDPYRPFAHYIHIPSSPPRYSHPSHSPRQDRSPPAHYATADPTSHRVDAYSDHLYDYTNVDQRKYDYYDLGPHSAERYDNDRYVDYRHGVGMEHKQYYESGLHYRHLYS